MALSPQDRAYYQEKLSWRGFIYLFIATVVMGAVAFPVMLYLQDYWNGHAATWNFGVAQNVAIVGMLLGTGLSVVMFFLARFYLWLGWLPRRR